MEYEDIHEHTPILTRKQANRRRPILFFFLHKSFKTFGERLELRDACGSCFVELLLLKNAWCDSSGPTFLFHFFKYLDFHVIVDSLYFCCSSKLHTEWFNRNKTAMVFRNSSFFFVFFFRILLLGKQPKAQRECTRACTDTRDWNANVMVADFNEIERRD